MLTLKLLFAKDIPDAELRVRSRDERPKTRSAAQWPRTGGRGCRRSEEAIGLSGYTFLKESLLRKVSYLSFLSQLGKEKIGGREEPQTERSKLRVTLGTCALLSLGVHSENGIFFRSGVRACSRDCVSRCYQIAFFCLGPGGWVRVHLLQQGFQGLGS